MQEWQRTVRVSDALHQGYPGIIYVCLPVVGRRLRSVERAGSGNADDTVFAEEGAWAVAGAGAGAVDVGADASGGGGPVLDALGISLASKGIRK